MITDSLNYVSLICSSFSLIVSLFVAYMQWLRPAKIRANWFSWLDNQEIHVWLNLWNSGPIPINVVKVRFCIRGQYVMPITKGFIDAIAPRAARTLEFVVRDQKPEDQITFSAEILYAAPSGFKRWRKANVIASVWKEATSG